MGRKTYLQIDRLALQHNLARVKHYAPNSAILAIVKANAYGHGLEPIATALQAADALGVACLEEAEQLRTAGIRQPIVLMEGFFNADELSIISALQLDIVIHHWQQIEILEQQPLATPINAWLKIDTGMHRLGFLPDEAITASERLKSCSSIRAPLRLLTHFSSADELNNPRTTQQQECFQKAIAHLNAPCSLANSAGILGWPGSHADWVRPGIMLYGVSPFTGKTGSDFDLKPVMTLHSELIAVRQLRRGDTVGYAGRWTCPEDMPVGIIAIGYGDGYPRHAANGTPVLVNGKIAPLVGRVSMDMIAVDLRSQRDAKVGMPVVLWGTGLPVETVASHANTIAYELLCHVVAPRLPRQLFP